MERGSVDKGVGRYIVIALVIIAVVEVCSLPILYYMAGMPDYSVLGPHFERIEIKSVSVSKSLHTYFIYINFVNTGTISTTIDSVLLNGVPYDDSGWAGTIKPTVFGDVTSGTLIKSEGPEPLGIIDFSDDCVYIPSGYRLMAGVTVKITIHATSGMDYDASVTLP